MSEKRTLSAGPQGPGLGRNSGTDRGGVDVNFASILSLDVSGGWYVLRVSGDGAATGDASAMKVLRQFFAGHHGWEGSLPAPLAREFFDSRDWGLSNSPSRNWRSVTTVQAGVKLVKQAYEVVPGMIKGAGDGLFIPEMLTAAGFPAGSITVLEGDEAIGPEVVGIVESSSRRVSEKDPAHMRPEEAAVDIVRIAVLVDEAVVVTMIAAPLESGVLDAARAKEKEYSA